MTGAQLLKIAVAFLVSEKAEYEKSKLKFELDNPEGLRKWQEKILSRDKQRIDILSGLIQVIQVSEMDYNNNDKVLTKIEELEDQFVIKGTPDLRDYVIECLIIHLSDMNDLVQTLPKGITKLSLQIPLILMDKILCDYKVKLFTTNNIPYVIED